MGVCQFNVPLVKARLATQTSVSVVELLLRPTTSPSSDNVFARTETLPSSPSTPLKPVSDWVPPSAFCQTMLPVAPILVTHTSLFPCQPVTSPSPDAVEPTIT